MVAVVRKRAYGNIKASMFAEAERKSKLDKLGEVVVKLAAHVGLSALAGAAEWTFGAVHRLARWTFAGLGTGLDRAVNQSATAAAASAG